MSVINKLLAKKILKITYGNDIVIPKNKKNDVLFETPMTMVIEQYTLNIYNPFLIKGSDTDVSLRTLEGLTIINIKEQVDELSLKLENNIELIIDLREGSFKGPEALSLYGPDNLIVVWN